jgi:hypothetical protein
MKAAVRLREPASVSVLAYEGARRPARASLAIGDEVYPLAGAPAAFRSKAAGAIPGRMVLRP